MDDVLLNDLRKLVATPQSVLVIVGSGVSIGATQGASQAGVASWGGLLGDGVRRCRALHAGTLTEEWERSQLSNIASGDLDTMISTAETLSRKLGAPAGGEFSRWLRETVGSLSARNRAVLDALRDLGVPLATTNYDGLLSEVTGLPPVTWRNRNQVSRVLRREEEGILHLHGHWKDPESVVLGVRSYDQVREDPHAEAVRHALGMTRSLVFVGCGDGLQDPNFGPFLAWLGRVSVANEARHYRLSLNRSVASLQASHPPEQRIVVVGFGEGHGDLAGFLRSLAPRPTPVPVVPPGPTPGPRETSMPKAPEERPAQIVPRGLRSFEAEDHPWYLRLAPGPRDEAGFPAAISFWRDAIEKWDSERAFRLALLFGPSGCGKSSLVKAGVLPCLSPEVVAVYVEASAGNTEQHLVKALRKAVPDLPEGQSLADACAAVVRQPALTGGRKVVVFLDQFEQWLHAHPQATDGELVQGLRHADGTHLQAVVMVRAEFFGSVHRFFESLGVKLRDGRNLRRLDLLDEKQAREVLEEDARAFGKEPGTNDGAATASFQDFLQQVLDSFRQPTGDFVCAHLALLAEMLKNRAWVPETLRQIGGVHGVGLDYLRSTFDARRHGRPDAVARRSQAMAVFARLLPAEGMEIRGPVQSAATLAAAAGLPPDRGEFQSLITLLDDELKLITPSEAEGGTGSDARHYQLTHDYLVQALRRWLAEEEDRTRPGRARKALKRRASQWKAEPGVRSLPGLWEYAQILCWVPRGGCNPDERAVIHSAGILWSSVAALCLCLLAGGWLVDQRLQETKVEMWTRVLIRASDPEARDFREALTDLRRSPRAARRVLMDRWRQLPGGAAGRANVALALAELGNPGMVAEASRRSTNPASRTALIHALKAFSDRPWLNTLIQGMTNRFDPGDTAAADLRSALCSGLALVPTNLPLTEFRRACRPILEHLHREAPDGGTHSAAACVLTRWGVPVPVLPSRPASLDRAWFINTLGMTLVQLPEGDFLMEGFDRYAARHRVALGRSFYMMDREVTVAWFRQYLQSGAPCTNAARILLPQKEWDDAVLLAFSPDDNCPVHKVSWEDAVGFCNWLSCREGSPGWYRVSDQGQWELNPAGRGYRLPTEDEWEYACRAMSEQGFAFGEQEDLLSEYAWWQLNSEGRTWPAGSRLPNLWGLHDLHGSVWEWCHDWYAPDVHRHRSVRSPWGPELGTARVARGGSANLTPLLLRSAFRDQIPPGSRKPTLGFRCVWVDVSSP